MYWSPLTPRTIFRGIQEIPPGHYMVVQNGNIHLERYWSLKFPPDRSAQPKDGSEPTKPVEAYLEEFQDLLIDATRIRLRADVPVGAYLSGGIDSSTITAIIRNYCFNQLDTFSIAFSDPAFDESEFQLRMARHLGTNHQVVYANHVDIGSVFPEVIWHTEVPILRTAPAPMFLLSKLVNDHKYKVVLTGEGADEFLGGYQIFQEAKVRRFWAPSNFARPLLLKRLYPPIKKLTNSDTCSGLRDCPKSLLNIPMPSVGEQPAGETLLLCCATQVITENAEQRFRSIPPHFTAQPGHI
jgi:asparagine synthase (glutamine-hydrolysing)